ncbi:MAG: biopolymer transporter ExbD [Planctomycetes bacterium]|nr:biopolymer transporter ExbD [Planctomycetota bacterium]
MNFKQRRERGITSIPRLSLVAFIDIVLFLLLYLMLAGTLAAPESRLAAGIEKTSAAGAKAPDLPPLQLKVDRVNDRPAFQVGQRQLSSQGEVASALLNAPKQGGVLVRSGPRALVEDVAAAMQAAKDAGFTRVSYAATP